MKITAVSFTENGTSLVKKLAEALGAEGYAFEKYASDGLKPFKSLTEMLDKKFDKSYALIFVGACGIAVRAIAPHIKSKTTDPAVLVIDEKGKFVIPILSGHIGGANELAEKIAALIGASVVITTATDINGVFAVDVFAKKNNLHISDMQTAKLISAELLRGHKIGLYSDIEFKNPPDCFCKSAEIGICISHNGDKKPFKKTLNLIPKNVILGVGCKKGTSDITVSAAEFLKVNGISIESVCKIASIDIKKDEPAIKCLAAEWGVPFETFTTAALAAQKGDFTASEFVKETVGVDNVCERSVAAAGGELTVKKTAAAGVTFAAGTLKFEANFGK